MSWEAEQISKILKNNNFESCPVVCKVGLIPKINLEVPRLRGNPSKEVACKPIGQAHILNQLVTQMNMILGLCIGHHMIFTKFSKAPVTTLIVKDRVLAHNPAAAIYSQYYKKIFPR